MKRVWVVTALLVLMVVTVFGMREEGIVSAANKALPVDDIVVYVDNKVVDLMWYTALSDVVGWRLERDPGGDETITPEPVGNSWFYRDDRSAYPDTDVSYRLCALLEGGGEDCSWSGVAHVGQTHGQLYKDRTWSLEIYQLSGHVNIQDGVTLKIYNYANVSPMPGLTYRPGIVTTQDSHLQIVSEGGPPPTLSGIRIDINDRDTGSSIWGVEGSPITLDGVWIRLFGLTGVVNCSLKGGSTISVHPGPYRRQIGYNQFSDDAHVEMEGGAAYVYRNTFEGMEAHPYIQVLDGSQATITENTFEVTSDYSPAIVIGGSDATVEKNQFQLGGSEYVFDQWGVQVRPDGGGTVAITDNSFRSVGLYRGSGIRLGAFSGGAPNGEGPPAVTVMGNLFSGLQNALGIGDRINVDAQSNSFTQNQMGVNVQSAGDLGTVKVYASCIAGNGIGLVGPAGVNATGNWWGSPLGPIDAEGNPAGGGDICSGAADCTSFLKQDNCTRQARNLWIYHIEPTQGIQTYYNAVPIVAGKPAAIRAYVASTTGVVSGVGGELVVRRSGQLVGTLQLDGVATTPYLSLVEGVPNTPARFTQVQSQRSSSLVFRLPKEWVTGTLTLAATVNPGGAIEEADSADNTKVITVTTQQARPVRVGIVPVRPPNKQRLAQQAVDPASVLDIATLFRKVYPSSQLTLTLLPEMDWPYTVPEAPVDPEANETGAMLLGTLSMAQVRLRTDGGWDGEAFDQVFGVVAGETLQYTRPDPVIEGGRGGAAYSSNDQVAFANALGLNLGHDPKYTGLDPVAYWGYDLTTDRLVSPDTTDVFTLPVSYFESPHYTAPFDPSQFWVGPHSYNELLAHNLGAGVSAQAPARTAELQTSASQQTYALVSGVYDTGAQKATFSPVWQVTTAEPPSNPPPPSTSSRRCVQLRDAGDSVLSEHCFYVSTGWDTSWENWGTNLPFLVSLPLSGAPARLVFVDPSFDPPYDEKGSLAISANVPVVTIDGGTIARQSAHRADAILPFSWSGQDDDGDDLHYSVFYSADDGATWRPVATNLTADHYTLDLAEVPGGVEAWVRVEVSDGFHTASDTLGPFAVADHGPLVTIAQPAAGTVVSSTVGLLGYAYDHEEGELTGASLVWTSDLAGELGTGASIVAEDLVTGTHRITLTATDSQGHSASASVLVGVETPVEWPEEVQTFVFLPITLRR